MSKVMGLILLKLNPMSFSSKDLKCENEPDLFYMWVLIVTLHDYLHFPGNCVDLMTCCLGDLSQHSSAPDHCCWGDNLEQAPRKNLLLCASADPPVGRY